MPVAPKTVKSGGPQKNLVLAGISPGSSSAPCGSMCGSHPTAGVMAVGLDGRHAWALPQVLASYKRRERAIAETFRCSEGEDGPACGRGDCRGNWYAICRQVGDKLPFCGDVCQRAVVGAIHEENKLLLRHTNEIDITNGCSHKLTADIGKSVLLLKATSECVCCEERFCYGSVTHTAAV